ncbi:dTMP kinase [Ellagibacter isourolithinifaciens]|uniref:dTMP kinase n=1 Tax=Ellagibacter isourolithinifaciens TaxID=2137581 RepID=UPI001FE6618D|nr:dTMP kinase [Ellagibacter isourolithinifaciens]
MPLTPERHTAEPAQPVSEREGYDAQGAPASGRPEGDSPRGVFVTFEGGDGVGKSTHIRYVANELRRTGREVVCLREPGGTGIGESLRAMVLDPDNGEISSEAELLMYEAARAQLVREVIRPALERGAVVLCDRFSDSTIAYQAYGRGLPLDFVRRANAFATGGIVPDRTILLVLGNTRKSLARATGAGAGDRMEQAGEVFHSRVNRAFLKLAKRDPKRIRIVRSSSSRKATAAAVAAELADILPELSARAEGATPSQPAAPHGEGAAKGKPQAKRKRGGRGKRGNRG